jgi:hypothetical protein
MLKKLFSLPTFFFIVSVYSGLATGYLIGITQSTGIPAKHIEALSTKLGDLK